MLKCKGHHFVYYKYTNIVVVVSDVIFYISITISCHEVTDHSIKTFFNIFFSKHYVRGKFKIQIMQHTLFIDFYLRFEVMNPPFICCNNTRLDISISFVKGK